jgi:hypothetical protein
MFIAVDRYSENYRKPSMAASMPRINSENSNSEDHNTVT